jgi:subtilase family serine protease
MAHIKSFGLPIAILLLASVGAAQAQTSASRLAGDWRSTASVQIPASRPPINATESDLGAASPNTQLQRMLLLLSPSASQQQALAAELTSLQNPASPGFHHWLTPAAFADAYGNSATDVAAITSWLQSQGLVIAPLPAGRGWIEFSGTVAQVEQAFQAGIHSVSTPNGTRPVLMGDISVPGAFTPLITGLVSLDGALSSPALTTPQRVISSVANLAEKTTLNNFEALTPQLAAQLIHLDALHSSGIDGKGETIAIASRSNVNTSDIAAFRSAFALAPNPLQVILNGADPGLTADQAEATLASSWAGATAPGAKVLLVPAASTTASDGVDLSLAAIVDQALAHTVAIGYSSCEAALSPAHQAFYSALYQQAAAEGIAVIAATGDSGPSACHAAGSDAPVSTGYAVNALASTPWNTAVGVAAFSPAGPQAGNSVLAAWSPAIASDPAFAGGGGISTLHAGPAWQPVPAQLVPGTSGTGTSNRLLPDAVLPTAIDSGVNPGLAFCLSSSLASSACNPVRAGGSSAAAALFAGVSALINQKHGEQGNLAPGLYALRTTNGVFNDIQQGSAQLKCAAGSPGCDATGQIGYAASTGFDLATGLGAVNANGLVSNWASPELGSGAVNVSLAISPVQTNNTYNPAANVTLTATVLSSGGGTAPTGSVVFYDSTTSLNLTQPLTINSSGVVSTTLEGVFALGGNEMIAEYTGDTNYAATNSNPPVNVNTQASTTSLTVNPATTTAAPGQNISVTVNLTVGSPVAGTVNPSGVVTLNVDGGQETYTASLSTSGGVTTASFPSVLIPANGTLTTHTLQAIYPSNTDYSGSTSPQVVITVSKTTPSVFLTPATSTPLPGSNLLLTATISPTISESAPPTGTVTFTMDGAQVGTVTVSTGTPSSTATLTITAPQTGTHTLVATYNGDSVYNTATSNNATITVSKIPTTLSLNPATTTPIGGSSLLLTATLTPTTSTSATPTGNVTFSLDGSNIGTGNLVNGTTATFTMTVPASGSHTVQAVYAGDTNFNSANSSVVTLTVAKIVTSTVATPTTTTPASGSTLQVSATITPASYTSSLPTGNVVFTLDGTTTEGTATLVSGTPSTATVTFTVPSAGTHTVTAAYSGDTNYAASTSNAVTLTVAKTTTTLTITPSTTTPLAGSSLQVTADIFPAATLTSLPSGTVTFTIDGINEGIGTVTSGSPATTSLTFTVPSAGSHVLGATYSGDTNYLGSTATSVTLNVSKSTPTVVVTPATQTPSAGSNLQVTASISPPASGGTSPSGTVNFALDGNNIGTSLVIAGSPSTATITITAPSVGTHNLTATYNGDSNYNSVSAVGVTITVSKGSTTLTVTPSTTTPLGGSNFQITATISATVSGSTFPSGTVTFLLDGANAGNATIIGGTTASTTIVAPTTGTHSLQATYSGDSNFNGSVSTTVNITVARTPTTLVVTPSTTTPALGATLPVTATITPSTLGATLPSGTITFTVDGVTTSIQAVTPGSPSTASVSLPALTPGTHQIAATYTGDNYYASSTATSVTVTVPKEPTTMTITPATTTPSGGSSLAVTAAITPAAAGTTLPTGTVTFSLDGAAVGGSQAVVPGSPATASVVLPSMTPGTHILQAAYSGDTYYAASNSPAVTITVSKSPTSIVLTPSTLTPSAGGSMVVTTYITSSSPATASPSGTVSITLDGITVGTGTVVPGAPSTAVVTIPLVDAGSHILEAVYSGDIYYTGSTSATVSIVAAKGVTVTTLTATPPTLTPATTETLTATIAPLNSVTGTIYTITGTVSFYDGGTTLLGQVAVASNVATLTGIALKDNISHTITAVYSGDVNWLGSASTVLPLAASTLPDFVVLTSNLTTVQPGQALVLTATVTPNSLPSATGEQNPTGLVIFYNGTTVIGQSALTASTVALSDASTATLTIQTLPGGQDAISAYYEGDLYYDAAASNILSLAIESFTITPSSTNPPTNLNIDQGAAGSASFVITGFGGFNNQVQLVCAVPTQDDMTCSVSPQQIVPTGTVTFVIQTYISGGPAYATASRGNGQVWQRAAGGTALAVLFGFFLLPAGRRARIFTNRTSRRFLILLLLLVGLGGAGIGCTSTAGTAVGYGTPLGVATLKITGTAYVDNTVVSQSTYLTVNVLAPGTVAP